MSNDNYDLLAYDEDNYELLACEENDYCQSNCNCPPGPRGFSYGSSRYYAVLINRKQYC